MNHLAALFVRYRGPVGWMLLGVTLVAAAGYVLPARSQHPLERYETPLEPDPPTQSERVQSRFNLGGSDAFLVVRGERLFTPASIAAVRRAVAAVEGLEFVDSVFWADRVPVLNVFGFADPLIPPSDASAEAFRDAEPKVREHPLAGQLVSDDGTALLMPVVFDWLRMTDPPASTDAVLSSARAAIAAGAPPTEPLTVALTGRAPLFFDQQAAFDRNQILFQAIGYTLALVLSAIMFRGLAAVAVVASAPCLGVFWTLGLVRLLGIPSNPLAEIVMPVMIAMVGLTDGVHLLVHIRRRRAAGDEPVEAARSAIAHVGLACWLTSLTTAVGFGSLLLAQSDYVRDFGRVCCFGVLVAFVAVVAFIPWVCSTRLGRVIERGHERDLVGRGVAALSRYIDLILRRKGWVSLASVGLTAALLLVTLRLAPDNRMKSALPSGSESYSTLEYCDRHFGGIEFFRVEVHWPEGVEADDPGVLAAVRDVEKLIETEPLLSRPLSVRTMLATFPGDPEDLAAQSTFLSLLPRELRGHFYDPATRTAIVSVRMQDRGIAKYAPVFDRLEAEFDALADERPGYSFALDGQPIRVARDLFQIVTDLRSSLGAASGIILLVLGLAYRSAWLGAISVVPNLFPLVFTGALLLATGSPLDMSSVCAFVVCLGIAVDDTIHFLSRFRHEMASGAGVDESIRRSLVGVGAAMIMTTVILCCGFGTMLLSDLPGHRTFAAMAVSTIGAAIVGDLVALPALLSSFYPRRKGGAPPGAASPEIGAAERRGAYNEFATPVTQAR